MTDTYADAEARKKRKGDPYGFSPFWSPSGGLPFNEPAGFTPIVHVDFSLAITPGATDAAGWRTQNDAGVLSRGADGTDKPYGNAFYLNKLFPSGMASGVGAGNFFPSGAPITGVIPTASDVTKRLYVRTLFYVSSNWVANITVNKDEYFILTRQTGGAEGNGFYTGLYAGSGAGPLTMGYGVQTTLDTRTLSPNLGSGVVSRGAWHIRELVLQQNTGTNLDGAVDSWLDYVKTHHYTNVGISENATLKTWDIQLSDVYGGLGPAVPADQNIRIGDLYMSVGT